MPGPTDTEFFDLADMQGTKLREQTAKDDPAEVAREGGRSGSRDRAGRWTPSRTGHRAPTQPDAP